MSYHGDFRLGDTLDLKFTTRAFATGVPTTLAGSPVISAYPGNSTTQLTAGITLSVDFDSVTGLNNVRVVATSGNGYATATNYELVITTGTVGGTSVVGEVIGSFSIEARSALMPTAAAVTLDVAAGGEAGVDWGNVANKTTTNALTNTSIITTQKVDVDTIKTNPVVNGGTITFPTTATLASTTNITAATGVDITKILGTAISTPATAGILDVNVKNIDNDAASASGTVTFPNATLASTTNVTAGTITTVTNLTNAPTAGDLTATMKTSVTTAATAATPTAAAVTGNVGGNVTGSVGSVVGLTASNLDVAVSTLAPAATALSTAQWTNTRAGYIDNLNALKIKKNTALAAFAFLMVDSADHITPKTGLTVAVQRSIDGAAFGNATNTPATELANGVYTISLSAADLNGNVITLKMTATGADQRIIVIATEP